MKIVAWIFLVTALIGCLDHIDSRPNANGSYAPIMIGLVAIAGAYLLRHSQGGTTKEKSLNNEEK